MNYHHTTLPIQEMASGAPLTIHAYTFTGAQPGPTLYLQGNLHGPEVFGTALLIALINTLKKSSDIQGKIIVVPCANPMAVNQTAYNSMVGRWNAQSGTNWNRLFPITPLANKKEEKEFYQQLLLSAPSTERTLAATLRSLSADADYVLDIHTTGSATAEHLFTYPWMHDSFAALRVPIHLTLDPQDTVGAFDESHVVPFIESTQKNKIAQVATWEAHHHSNIDAATLKERLMQLLNWIDAVAHGSNETAHQPTLYASASHLHAPIGGYYSWLKHPGDIVQKGEPYAMVYQPHTGEMTPVAAQMTFTLIGIYGVAATASGEQIAWIAEN